MEFVACKMLGEYNRNKQKIKKFFLDEQKAKEDNENQKWTPNRTQDSTLTTRTKQDPQILK